METLTNSATILVVDDNPTNLEIIDHALSGAGYNLRFEVEGSHVMKQVYLNLPDLILLDIMLPDITGFEVCRQLKADPLTHSTPVIFMTALSDTVDKIKGLSLGAVDYITKPFQAEELLARVRTHLQLRQLSKALEMQNQQLIQLTEELEHRVAERTAELRKALAKEKELSELKSRFITMASHEFRTPLAIISSSSSILQKFSDRLTEEAKQEHLTTIQKTIKHITQLLDDVLMINRAEAQKIEFKPESLDIIDFCRSLNAEIATTATKHTIDFSCDLDGQKSDGAFMVKCDKKLMRQILTNILTNAIKYSPHHHLVSFSLTKDNQQLIFQISDRGIGISESEQRNLFVAFQRGSNVGNISGTGLGLSIVKKCVDLHQGRITLHSQIGEGTTVTVAIPYTEIDK
jgi:two-component system sensor histidine kinase/response regulator